MSEEKETKEPRKDARGFPVVEPPKEKKADDEKREDAPLRRMG